MHDQTPAGAVKKQDPFNQPCFKLPTFHHISQAIGKIRHFAFLPLIACCLLALNSGGFNNPLISRAFARDFSVTPAKDDLLYTRPLPGNKGDRTLSPYFWVNSEDPSRDALPLKSTSADVDIAGVIADVKVTQVYQNTGNRPLEAVYVFPASSKAAVYAMQMTIGKRTIVANIRKKAEARHEYEQAKVQGRSASLLEQHRPNVFQMNVANIMPGDEIEVEMHYTELLIPTDGIYEFIYPTVVGPRYSNQPASEAPESDQFVANPYTPAGQPPTYTFDMSVSVSSAIPIRGIACPTHEVEVLYKRATFADIVLDQAEIKGGNRDFVLRYRLAGDQIQTGMLLYEGTDENFFLVMAQPPARVSPDMVPPRDYIFIVDISGSMNGFPLATTKALMRNLIGKLRPTDTFNVLLFAGSSYVLSPSSIPATSENLKRAIEVVEQQRGGGGTEIVPALRRAFALPASVGLSRSVVVVTDGFVHVEPQVFELIRNNLGEANVFAFGIGSSVNRHLIEGIARAGQGEPFVILNPEEAPAKAEQFRTYIESPLLTDLSARFAGFDAYDIEPKMLPDVMADRPVLLFGKWRGVPKGTLTLEGFGGNNRYRVDFNMADTKPRAENRALRYLWARHRISTLADDNQLKPNDERVKEVTSLGLTYHLLTDYTSFVAVDSLIRNPSGTSDKVDQVLPLPAGVSNGAVGMASASASGFSRGVVASPPVAVTPGSSPAQAGAKLSYKSPSPLAAEETVAVSGHDPRMGPRGQEKEEKFRAKKAISLDNTAAPAKSANSASTKDEKPAAQKSTSAAPAKSVRAGINGTVEVLSGDANPQTLRTSIEQQLNGLQGCLNSYTSTTGPLTGHTLEILLSADRNGKITRIEIKTGAAVKDWGTLSRCLESVLEKWLLNVGNGKLPSEVRFDLKLT